MQSHIYQLFVEFESRKLSFWVDRSPTETKKPGYGSYFICQTHHRSNSDTAVTPQLLLYLAHGVCPVRGIDAIEDLMKKTGSHTSS